TFLPRIKPATRLSLRGETLRFRTTARASFSGRLRSRFSLPMLLRLHRFLVAAVSVEGARRRELPELVADHVLGHRHWDVLVAVVHAERQADELRQARRAAAPHLDDLLPPPRPHPPPTLYQ